MVVTRALAGACICLSALPACGLLFHRNSNGNKETTTANVSVEVESHHWSDVVIYLMNGSQSERLGTVSGLSTTHFVFPYRRLATGGNLRLRAYPIGGPGPFTSENVLVQPGQSVKWTLESDLARSFLGISGSS